MEVSAYTPPPSETDVDMEPESLQNHSEDVVGGASPMSTAVTGSISWYSMPPSETNSLARYRNKPDKSLHQLRTAMHHQPPNRERAFNLSILTVSGPDYLEGLALNESAVGSELNKAFLEAEETDKERT
ncbi:hypothetical protein OSTOST_16911, partial [Ostertagia ostertagi]